MIHIWRADVKELLKRMRFLELGVKNATGKLGQEDWPLSVVRRYLPVRNLPVRSSSEPFDEDYGWRFRSSFSATSALSAVRLRDFCNRTSGFQPDSYADSNMPVEDHASTLVAVRHNRRASQSAYKRRSVSLERLTYSTLGFPPIETDPSHSLHVRGVVMP